MQNVAERRKQITSSVRCFEEFISPDKEKQGREHIQQGDSCGIS